MFGRIAARLDELVLVRRPQVIVYKTPTEIGCDKRELSRAIGTTPTTATVTF